MPASPLFDPRPRHDFERPRRAMLAMKLRIGLRYAVRIGHVVINGRTRQSVRAAAVCLCPSNRGVDGHIRDVDSVRASTHAPCSGRVRTWPDRPWADNSSIISGLKAFIFPGLSITIFRMWPFRSERTRPAGTTVSPIVRFVVIGQFDLAPARVRFDYFPGLAKLQRFG